MNKYLRFLLPALSIIFLLTSTATETSAQGIIKEILKRMDNNNKSLVSLKSDIKMAKRDAALGDTDLSEGDLSYLPGKSDKQVYVRINWSKPREEQLAVANGEYVLYTPKLNRALVGKVDSVKKGPKGASVLSFMSMSRAELSASYDVEYKGEETVSGGTNTWHLVLTPKKASSYKSADLWVDKDGMPVQAKIIEKNNDTTTVNLSNIQRNATIKGNVFKISPPKGTEIVRG
jgi:outer membrane lipoprotein-sorting protein